MQSLIVHSLGLQRQRLHVPSIRVENNTCMRTCSHMHKSRLASYSNLDEEPFESNFT